jgi:hypothetical protein
MKNKRPITTMKLFDQVSIAASQDEDSVVVDLREIAQNGYFSIYYVITGTGTLKLEYQASAEKSGTYVTPNGASEITTGLTAGQGMYSFSPMLSPFLRIKATETGGANAAVLSLFLNVQ